MHELAAELQKAQQQDDIDTARRALLAGGWVLGILQEDPESHFTRGAADSIAEGEIDALIAERNAARADKNFARADEIRDQLAAAGIELEDLREGTRWRRS